MTTYRPFSVRLMRRFPWGLFLCALAWGALAGSSEIDRSANHKRLDRIINEQQLRVCVWPDYYGISWRDPLSGELMGIDVDLARKLGEDLGVAVRFVDSSFARLFDDLLDDRCDIAMFAIGITPHRLERLRFTTPHLASDIYAITTRSNRRIREWEDIDQPGVIVVVAQGTLHEPIMQERLQHATLVVSAAPQAREQEVESGRADVFITDFPFSRRMLDNTDWARLITPTDTYHITPYAWAIVPGDDAWHARLETFVGDIKRDGRLRAAAQRHGLDPIVLE